MAKGEERWPQVRKAYAWGRPRYIVVGPTLHNPFICLPHPGLGTFWDGHCILALHCPSKASHWYQVTKSLGGGGQD